MGDSLWRNHDKNQFPTATRKCQWQMQHKKEAMLQNDFVLDT